MTAVRHEAERLHYAPFENLAAYPASTICFSDFLPTSKLVPHAASQCDPIVPTSFPAMILSLP